MLPEWAPNLHPLVVHFPIALLIVAVLTDFLALVGHRYKWLRPAATGLYILGAIAAWAAFLSGREAAESVLLSATANPILTEHADWAQRTALFYSILAVGRFVVAWQGWIEQRLVHLFFLLVGAGGLFMLYETGDHGAQLVYRYGVGVSAVDQSQLGTHDHNRQQESVEAQHAHEAGEEHGHTHEEEELGPHVDTAHEMAATELHLAENGSWTWGAGPGSERLLARDFAWLTGTWENLRPAGVHDTAKGEVLALRPQQASALFVAGKPIGSLQADLILNSTGFDGTVMIVHHLQDARNYHFLALENGHVRLGEVRDGTVNIQEEGIADTQGWTAVRVVSDKTHFRGYVGGKMVVHGHGEEPPPGRAGLLVEGRGTLLLDEFEVEVLR